MAFSERVVVEAESIAQRVTGRAIAIGLGMALLVIVWNTFVEYIAHTARMNITHFPIALFAPFMVLTLVNAMLRRKGVTWALKSAEIWTILAMGLVASEVPAYGLTSYFLGMIAMPYYMATPENQWATYFHQYLPGWLIPTNDGGAMRWLFEGLPSPDMPIPWGVWVIPLFGWMMFITGIVVACVCLAVMLRKQWAEYERLAYPILQPAGDLAEAEARVPLLRNRFFIYGTAIAFTTIGWNIFSYFLPGFPRISLGPNWMSMGTYFPRVHVYFNLYTIGFAYFANVEVLFSIWFFYLFYCVQIMFYRRVGINLSGKSDSGDVTTSLQAGGAFLAMVIFGLWMARSHIRDVVKKAFNRSDIDDSDELLSYRTCTFGLILSTIFLIFWLHAVGIHWLVSIVLTLGLYLTYLGTARVIAETGVVYFSMPMSAEGLLPYLFGGPNTFNPPTQTALCLVDAVHSQGKGMFMPPLVHVARIGDMLKQNKRRLMLGIALTLIFGIGCAITFSLYLGYTYGAFNFNDFPFTRYPPSAYDGLVKALKGEVTWEGKERYFFLLLGVAIYAGTSFMRYRFAWWPLAPIGMVVPPTHAVHSMFAIFVAWIIKTIILRIGGVELYRKLRPFFLGLLVGHALGVLVSFGVDQVWFPGHGHGTHDW